MTKRIKIREQVEYISIWEFEGNLATVLENIQNLIQHHGPGANLVYNKNFYYEYDNQPSPRFELYVEREENDAELKQRLFEQAEHIRKREEAEKAEFERLSKKFGVEECWCESCKPNTMTDMRMILCQICGNKRCPHATNHNNECTNSNEPGQKGSSWENYKV